MSKVIKIDASNTDLGKIFAQIDETSSKEVRIIYDKEVTPIFSSSDITLIEEYAEKLGKSVKFTNLDKMEKAGFVIGEDINTLPRNRSLPKMRVKAPKINFGKPKLRIPVGILIFLSFILVGGALAFYFFNLRYPMAKVYLIIKSQVFTGTQETTIVGGLDKVNIKENAIPGELVSAQVNQEIIVIPTGEKELGVKARGELKIYNKTNSDKTIKKGTKILIKLNGDKEYLFYTLKEVKVGKKIIEENVTDTSGQSKKADVYGTAKVKIEADDIGNNYNINKDKVKSIKVGEYKSSSEISADIEKNPSGGDSKKVTVVLQKDLDDLKEKLLAKAKDKVQSKLLKDLKEEDSILSSALDIKIVNLVYDKKVNEEADKIVGNITLKASTLAYKKENLREVLANKIVNLVPGNFSVVSGEKNLVITSSSKKLIPNETSGNLQKILVSSKVQSSVAPKTDKDTILENIQNKRIEDAQKYLGEIANIVEAKIVISPNVPIFNKRLPGKSKINVDIKIIGTGQ